MTWRKVGRAVGRGGDPTQGLSGAHWWPLWGAQAVRGEGRTGAPVWG